MPKLGEFTKATHAALTAAADLHAPEAHADSHKSGGSDEVDVTGLTPADHASRHESGGADEMELTGLLGVASKVIPILYVARSGGGAQWRSLKYTVYIHADAAYAVFCFIVPHDFTSLTSAYIFGFSTGDGTDIDLDISSEYAKEGEDYNLTSESDTSSTYDFVANDFTKIDVSGILTGIEAGDHVSIKLLMKESYTLEMPTPVAGEVRYA